MQKKIIVFLLLSGCFFASSAYAADSTEYIKVFFNQPEKSTSTSEITNPVIGIDDALVDFLETAKSGDKVYLCFYSSTTPKITSAINAAATIVGDSNIFHIMEEVNGNATGDVVNDPGVYSFSNSIDDGSDGSGGNGYPLMHNKFAVVINANSQTGRVWTGSYNPTSNGTTENNNNAVWIESYDLAKIFADEFIYMWNGGSGKFSTAKSTSANTAKSITVGGVQIDVYFSPYPNSNNTNTSMLIEDLIENAEYSVLFSMFTFSEYETRLKEALKTAHNNGVEVKGIVEATQSSSLQSELRQLGMNVFFDANDKSYHHKFCVIDYGSMHAKVITGSYNWTASARDTNDENFVVIHSKEVAKIYRDEFQRSYALAGGPCSLDSEAVRDVLVYPSPAEEVDSVTIGYTLSGAVTEVQVNVYTLTGERVTGIEPEFYPGTYNEKTWELKNSSGKKIAPGLYIVKVEAKTGDGTFFDIGKFAVIR
jgi:hypothetical protein